MEFVEYANDRLMKRDPTGFIIILPKEQLDAVTFFCSICDCIFRSKDDELAQHEFGCCAWCADRWARSRKTLWQTGWRPSADEIEATREEREALSIVASAY